MNEEKEKTDAEKKLAEEKLAEEKLAESLEALKEFALGMIYLTPVALYSGLFVWLLWGWFAVPSGLPEVAYLHVCGLVVLSDWFRLRITDKKSTMTITELFKKKITAGTIFISLGFGLHLLATHYGV